MQGLLCQCSEDTDVKESKLVYFQFSEKPGVL